VDGGLGFLQGLGFTIADDSGSPVSGDASGLLAAHQVHADTAVDLARECEWVFLVDVDAPLCGAAGAARVFGPQKGLDPGQVDLVDSALSRWASLLGAEALALIPGTGAAGGVAFAALATMGARIESGAAYVASLIGLDDALAQADLVITGEGSFDGQSWAAGAGDAVVGKAPGVVIAMAARRGIPVGVVAGVVDVAPDDLRRHGVTGAASLVRFAGTPQRAMQDPARWLGMATTALLAELDVGTTTASDEPG
jgi:glycerate kinase